MLPCRDGATKVKQQCSDFVMTRNIQCGEIVGRQISGLSFQQPTEYRNTAQSSHPQAPYYPPSQQVSPYRSPAAGSATHQPQEQLQSHENGQPGWRGPYHNAPLPYTVPAPYHPSHQSGYCVTCFKLKQVV